MPVEAGNARPRVYNNLQSLASWAVLALQRRLGSAEPSPGLQVPQASALRRCIDGIKYCRHIQTVDPPQQLVIPVHCDFDITQRSLNFPRPFADRSRLIHGGLREIDVKNDASICFSSTLHNITAHSADCNVITWGDTTLFSAVADVIALTSADSDTSILIGEHMRSLRKNPNSPASVRLTLSAHPSLHRSSLFSSTASNSTSPATGV